MSCWGDRGTVSSARTPMRCQGRFRTPLFSQYSQYTVGARHTAPATRADFNKRARHAARPRPHRTDVETAHIVNSHPFSRDCHVGPATPDSPRNDEVSVGRNPSVVPSPPSHVNSQDSVIFLKHRNPKILLRIGFHIQQEVLESRQQVAGLDINLIIIH